MCYFTCMSLLLPATATWPVRSLEMAIEEVELQGDKKDSTHRHAISACSVAVAFSNPFD